MSTKNFFQGAQEINLPSRTADYNFLPSFSISKSHILQIELRLFLHIQSFKELQLSHALFFKLNAIAKGCMSQSCEYVYRKR